MKTLILCLGLFLNFSSYVWAVDPAEAINALIQQEDRPTVAQVEELLKTWRPTPLAKVENLPLDRMVNGGAHLFYNYPEWFRVLKEGSPEMIAAFEGAFPGAKFAFIGRDSEIFADLFEAFYHGLGEQDRVVRVQMSRPTLETLNEQTAVEYLGSLGLDIHNPKRPFILVDSVSHGGGRQGRFLLNAAFKAVQNDVTKFSNLVKNLGFIGLEVATTEKNFVRAPLSTVQDNIPNMINFYLTSPHPVDYAKEHPIWIFSDRRKQDASPYLSCNEAGYGHWVGLWHGSYGPLARDARGQLRATHLPFADAAYESGKYAIRRALLNYQATVIQMARAVEFYQRVRAAGFSK